MITVEKRNHSRNVDHESRIIPDNPFLCYAQHGSIFVQDFHTTGVRRHESFSNSIEIDHVSFGQLVSESNKDPQVHVELVKNVSLTHDEVDDILGEDGCVDYAKHILESFSPERREAFLADVLSSVVQKRGSRP